MKKIISLIIAMTLLAALVPGAVQAAQGGVTGQSKGGNTAPTVDAVTLVETGSDTQVTAMTPLSTYRVKATISDVNTIDDIAEVEFHVYHTTDGSQWDADAVTIFKWTKSTGQWTMQNGSATTTWEVVTGSSTAPSVFTGNTGDWYLAFKPGKLAEADVAQNWNASVTARDENKNGSKTTTTGATMGAYSEINFNGTASVVFGDSAEGIEPGQAGYITNPTAKYLTARVISNKQYALGVKTAADWNGSTPHKVNLVGGTGVPTGNGQFNLAVDDETIGANGAPKTPQAVTTATTNITGYDAAARVTTNANQSEATTNANFYMALSLSTAGIKEVTYSGAITFTVTN